MQRWSMTEDFIKFISEKDRIYIYGAGTYGIIFAKLLKINNIKCEGIIDQDKQKTGKVIYGAKVVQLSEIQNLDSVFVMVSLSSIIHVNCIPTVVENLIKAGIKNENIICLGYERDLINDVIYKINSSDKILKRNEKFKRLHAGKRCFIIGNGPSLRLDDLMKLSSEITMACNGIINVYKRISWRPTYFFAEDNVFLEENVSDEKALKNLLKNCKYCFTTLRNNLYDKYTDRYGNLFYLLPILPQEKNGYMKFSEDICNNIFSAGTTLYTMMQVAVYAGISELYLIGVDYSFRREMHADGSISVNEDVKNHMKYIEQVEKGTYAVDLIMEGYLCAKKYAEEHGIKIYNATRGGKLEVFERVNFDELF